MAEFQEMMRGWTEICKRHIERQDRCNSCPINRTMLCDYVVYNRPTKVIADAEAVITKYINEHPLPSTPTWIKWMMDNGLIDCVEDGNLKLTPLAYCQMDEDVVKKVGAIVE